MISILAQAGDWALGGGGIVGGGIGTWIIARILKKKVEKILNHPDDTTCHVGADAVNKHIADKTVHVDKEYIELRFVNIEDRLDGVHDSVKESRTDIKKILERMS